MSVASKSKTTKQKPKTAQSNCSFESPASHAHPKVIHRIIQDAGNLKRDGGYPTEREMIGLRQAFLHAVSARQSQLQLKGQRRSDNNDKSKTPSLASSLSLTPALSEDRPSAPTFGHSTSTELIHGGGDDDLNDECTLLLLTESIISQDVDEAYKEAFSPCHSPRRSNSRLTGGEIDMTSLTSLEHQCDNLLTQLEALVEEGKCITGTGDLDKSLHGRELVSGWVFFQIPIRRRLQTLAVSMFNFFIGAPLCLLLTILLLLTPLTAPFMTCYLVYRYVRLNYGFQQWPEPRRKWYTNSAPMYWLRDYFPVRLIVPKHVKKEMNPEKNYIFCYHPHGVHSWGAIVGLGSDAAGLPEKLPGITIHPQTLRANFMLPFWSTLASWQGCGDASKECITQTLRSGPGESVMLVVGGAEESLLASPKTNDLLLDKRKGFVKIALKEGAPLVPVFGFGETNCYGNFAHDNPKLQKWLVKIQKVLGFAPVLIKGRGWFNYAFGPLPHRRQIHTVVGEPLIVPKIDNPTADDVEKWHRLYTESLLALYRDYKCIYDLQAKKEAAVVR